MTDRDITIVDGKKIISVYHFELAKTLKNHYINRVEINSGFKSLEITNQSKDDISVIDEIIRTYQDQPSVKQIKNAITTSNTPKPVHFSFDSTQLAQRRCDNVVTTSLLSCHNVVRRS